VFIQPPLKAILKNCLSARTLRCGCQCFPRQIVDASGKNSICASILHENPDFSRQPEYDLFFEFKQ